MYKRQCEDWAALLLNDKTTVTVTDKNTASCLLGVDAQQTGGILKSIEFWSNANTLVELAFRSGTGAFVLSLDNLVVKDGMAAVSYTHLDVYKRQPAQAGPAGAGDRPQAYRTGWRGRGRCGRPGG